MKKVNADFSTSIFPVIKGTDVTVIFYREKSSLGLEQGSHLDTKM